MLLQGLCVAHAVHNGLTKAPGTHAFLHGEKASQVWSPSPAGAGTALPPSVATHPLPPLQVAIGTLTQLVLEGRPQAELDDVYGFCMRVGLPVTLAQVRGQAGGDAGRGTEGGHCCDVKGREMHPDGCGSRKGEVCV